MSKFWASFWTYQADVVEKHGRFMFPWWFSGFRLKADFSADADSIVTMIHASSESEAEKYIKTFFTDAEMRFCDPKPDDWTPNDRFPMKGQSS